MQIAELACQGDPPGILRGAAFSYPSDITLEQPGSLGAALGEFLARQGFSARAAVLGVPAKWLLLKPQSVPPTDSDSAADMLWLHAESCATPEVGEMVFDYLGQTSPDEPRNILLLGIARRRLDRLASAFSAAGVKILKIMPTTVALAAGARSASSTVLSVRPEAVELLRLDKTGAPVFRHLSATPSPGSWSAELRRAAASLNGSLSTNRHQELILWDDVGIGTDAVQQTEGTIGMPLVLGNPGLLGVSGTDAPDHSLSASAIALGLEASRSGACDADVLHPRLTAPVPAHRPRHVLWLGTAAAALILGILAGYLDLSRIQKNVTKVDANLQVLDPQVKVAKPFVANMKFAQEFQGRKVHYLTCMREITSAMPTDGQTYLTAFHLHLNGESPMKGEFSGKSASEQDVLALIDKLSSGRHFADLKRRVDAHDGKGGSAEVTFDVTFEYRPRT